jgi:copper chaperone NosL
MRIADPRFGSELVTVRGKVYKFDSVECLVAFSKRGDVAAADVHSLWVSDFANPGRLIDARSARYLRSDEIHSPMGLNALAFGAPADLEAARRQHQGEILSWEELRPLAGQAHEGWSSRAGSAQPLARR